MIFNSAYSYASDILGITSVPKSINNIKTVVKGKGI